MRDAVLDDPGAGSRPSNPALDSPLSELYWGSALILKSQKTQFAGEVFFTEPEARSSVVEHYLDTVGVDGSIPPAPTVHPGFRSAVSLTTARVASSTSV